MRQCLFCDQRANTGEHAWPDWILKKLKPTVIRGTLAGQPIYIKGPKPEIKPKVVCGECNPGWMSRLETASQPIIMPMMHDAPFPIVLDLTQQFTLSLWTVKTAIVWEAVSRKIRATQYPKEFRHDLRSSRLLPYRTKVWIGRYIGGGTVGAHAHDIRYTLLRNDAMTDRYCNGYACTFVVGHLALQLFTLHVQPEYDEGRIGIANKGDFDRALIQIFPLSRAKSISWPPPESFSDILPLANRWSLGSESLIS